VNVVSTVMHVLGRQLRNMNTAIQVVASQGLSIIKQSNNKPPDVELNV